MKRLVCLFKGHTGISTMVQLPPNIRAWAQVCNRCKKPTLYNVGAWYL